MTSKKPLTKRERLNRAAPQLLAALKAAIAQADANLPSFGNQRTPECSTVYHRCVRAIAKAEGKQ